MDGSYLTASLRRFERHKVSFAYIYVCRDSQMSASDGCFLVNPLKEDGRYDYFFVVVTDTK